MSVKRRSRIFASCCFANSRTFLASAIENSLPGWKIQQRSVERCGEPARHPPFDSAQGRLLAAKNAARMGHPAATIGRVERDRESLKVVAFAGNSIVFMAGGKRRFFLGVWYQTQEGGEAGTGVQ